MSGPSSSPLVDARFDTIAWPTELKYVAGERALHLTFDTGERFVVSAELLRVESPSAEVQGHDGVRRPVAGARQVGIAALEPVGNYAVRITFDDGHDTGLYAWRYLYELARDRDARMAAYEALLAEHGVSRDP